jgi:hypothetical protein
MRYHAAAPARGARANADAEPDAYSDTIFWRRLH